MHFKRKYCISSEVVYSYRDDFCYVGHIKKDECYNLKAPAIYVWQALEQHHSLQEIIDYFKAIHIEDASRLCQNIISQLSDCNLIAEDADICNNTYNKFKYVKTTPREVYISKMGLVLTDKCNFRCRHCYNKGSFNYVSHQMGVETWKAVINQAIEMGCFSFLITGGEPFADDCVFEIIDYLEQKNVIYEINSNGSLIDGAIADKLKNYKRLTSLSISVYGFSEDTYSSMCGAAYNPERLFETTKLMQQCGIPVSLKYVYTSYNYRDAFKVKEYESRYGIVISKDLSYIFPALKSDKASDMNLSYEQINSLYVKGCLELNGTHNPCNDCSMERCSVNFKGNVALCEILQELPVGNVFDNTLAGIWTKDQFIKIMRAHAGPELKCSDCVDKDFCARCIGISFNTAGVLHGCSSGLRSFTKACADCVKSSGINL